MLCRRVELRGVVGHVEDGLLSSAVSNCGRDAVLEGRVQVLAVGGWIVTMGPGTWRPIVGGVMA